MIRLLLLTTVASIARAHSSTAASAMALQALDFEVFGRVQGVFFRKSTKEQAMKLELNGWCKNTHQGTVQGHLEGPTDKIEEMMHWLKTTGSPSSMIERAEFTNQKEISKYKYKKFEILKD